MERSPYRLWNREATTRRQRVLQHDRSHSSLSSLPISKHHERRIDLNLVTQRLLAGGPLPYSSRTSLSRWRSELSFEATKIEHESRTIHVTLNIHQEGIY